MPSKNPKTEMSITQTFVRKHCLNAAASPSDAIIIMCFSMLNMYYLHHTNFSCSLCTEFTAGGTPHHSIHFKFALVSTIVVPYQSSSQQTHSVLSSLQEVLHVVLFLSIWVSLTIVPIWTIKSTNVELEDKWKCL